MDDPEVARILQQLGSPEPQAAWASFLALYSPLILQVVRLWERDSDEVGDCFVYVCEQLSGRQFRRLRQFQPEGPARFSTWLRAVLYNLCVDWHRREFGRQRLFRTVARLPRLEQEIFRRMYQEGLQLEEAVLTMQARFPGLNLAQAAEALERLRGVLTPRQLWLLTAGKRSPTESDSADELAARGKEAPDGAPDPEKLVVSNEQRAALADALSRLSAAERLLVRLRFEQGLTLRQVARLVGLADAQTADRRIKGVLERLRKLLT